MRPQEEQPQWRGSSGNLDSAPAGTPSAGPGGSGAGPLMCSAGAGASLLSWALPASACPRGRPDPGLCPGACAVGFALPGRATPSAEPPPEPLRAAPGTAQPPPHGASSSARAPPSCSRGRAAPSAEPPPEPPELLRSRRVPPCALQPLGSSAHSPGRAVALLLSRGARGHPRPPGSCSNSLGAPFRPGRSVQLLLLRDGALLSWGHSPRPQPGSSRAPPPWRPLFLYFFSPSSYLDRSANSSHWSIPGVLSLILRPNS